MIAAAVVLSYGRAELCELLAMWTAQTVRIPLLLYLDGVIIPCADGLLSANVFPYFGPERQEGVCIGAQRRHSIEIARRLFALEPEDAIVVLDDDDYYHPRHVELTLAALEGNEWTGALRMGLQLAPGEEPQLLVSEGGPGQHATWAMTLRTYDAGGGYMASDLMEDAALAARLGWDRCASHRSLTHIRRHHHYNLSGNKFNRSHIRKAPLCTRIEPITGPESGALEAWATARLFY